MLRSLQSERSIKIGLIKLLVLFKCEVYSREGSNKAHTIDVKPARLSMLLGAEGRLKIYLQNKAQVFQLKYEILIALQISNTFSTFEQIFLILTLNVFTIHILLHKILFNTLKYPIIVQKSYFKGTKS